MIRIRLAQRAAGRLLSPLITAALAVLMFSTNALAEDFIGLARDDSQAWFMSASGVAKQPNGEIQTDVYQVFRDGKPMGGHTAQFADFRIAYDCAGKTWHPVKMALFDEGFSLIGSGDLGNGAPQPITPDNIWGPAYACNPETATASRRLSGKNWREVASALHARMGPAKAPAVLKPSVRASADWGSCLAEASAPFVEGQMSPEAIADAALEKCQPFAQKFNLAAASDGVSASDIVAQRARSRENMIKFIHDQRAGAPQPAQTVWIKCLAAASMAAVKGSDSPELVMDHAFERCKGEEATALHALEQEMSPAKASATMSMLKATIREQSIPFIQQQRAKKP